MVATCWTGPAVRWPGPGVGRALRQRAVGTPAWPARAPAVLGPVSTGAEILVRAWTLRPRAARSRGDCMPRAGSRSTVRAHDPPPGATARASGPAVGRNPDRRPATNTRLRIARRVHPPRRTHESWIRRQHDAPTGRPPTLRLRRSIALALAASALAATVAAPTAAAAAPAGSVLALLETDGTAYDTNWYDYDILEAAARTVLTAKPGSDVAALTVANANITVFAPNDRAFQLLVASLTGRWYWSESTVVTKLVEYLGGDAVDTIEAVLLYHVIGDQVTWSEFKSAKGTSVTTALGSTIGIRYYSWWDLGVIVDKDRNAVNPTVVRSKRDIFVGTNSVVHGISLVLRPVDLPPISTY